MIPRPAADRRARWLVPALGALALAWATGCAGDPAITQLTLVAPEVPPITGRILEPRVEGRWCFTQSFVQVVLRPPWQARRANHSPAIAAALEQVPDANALMNAQLLVEVQQFLLFQRTCAIARGDAGVMQ
ncbi:MAG: hypothetical protein QNK03_17510 [Myxococcota bacterium]|nr:hypothetical protein [Myxococcota bacterium]